MQLLRNQLLANLSRFGLAVAIAASTLAGQTNAQVNFRLTDQEPTLAGSGTKISPIVEHRAQAQTVHRYALDQFCLLYTSPSPRDKRQSRMPSSA